MLVNLIAEVGGGRRELNVDSPAKLYKKQFGVIALRLAGFAQKAYDAVYSFSDGQDDHLAKLEAYLWDKYAVRYRSRAALKSALLDIKDHETWESHLTLAEPVFPQGVSEVW